MSVDDKRAKRLPQPVALFLLCLALFWALSLTTALWPWLHTGRFAPMEPLAPPLPGIDFWIYSTRIRLLHQPAFFTQPGYPWTYPAPAALVYAALYRLCPPGQWRPGWVALLCFTVAGYSFAAFQLCRAAPRGSTRLLFPLTALLAWPAFISLQRGNIESLLFLLLGAAVWAFHRKRWTAAAVLIGIAGSCKLYPLLLLGLFLPPRLWKQFVLGIVAAAVTTMAALWCVNPDLGYAYLHVAANVHLFTQIYAGNLGRSEGIYDHSAFELVKLLARPAPAAVGTWITGYFLVAGALATAAYLARIWALPWLNQLLFLVTAAVMLPPASFDYTLQFLYIAFAAIALAALQGRLRMQGSLGALMILFALEFGPLTFLRVHDVTINGAIKGAALTLLICFAARYPMHLQEEGALSSGAALHEVAA